VDVFFLKHGVCQSHCVSHYCRFLQNLGSALIPLSRTVMIITASSTDTSLLLDPPTKCNNKWNGN